MQQQWCGGWLPSSGWLPRRTAWRQGASCHAAAAAAAAAAVPAQPAALRLLRLPGVLRHASDATPSCTKRLCCREMAQCGGSIQHAAAAAAGLLPKDWRSCSVPPALASIQCPSCRCICCCSKALHRTAPRLPRAAAAAHVVSVTADCRAAACCAARCSSPPTGSQAACPQASSKQASNMRHARLPPARALQQRCSALTFTSSLT